MRKTKQDVKTRLKQLLGGGKLRYRAIAEKLNAEGYKTPRGKKWKDINVADFVSSHKEDALKFMGTEPSPVITEAPEDAPPMELPAAAKVQIAKDIPFFKFILLSRELTDTQKVEMLKVLV
jgi:hypothetical protein